MGDTQTDKLAGIGRLSPELIKLLRGEGFDITTRRAGLSHQGSTMSAPGWHQAARCVAPRSQVAAIRERLRLIRGGNE